MANKDVYIGPKWSISLRQNGPYWAHVKFKTAHTVVQNGPWICFECKRKCKAVFACSVTTKWSVRFGIGPFWYRPCLTRSDVKFHEMFWREIFHEIFLKISGCIVHCIKVSKPVKGKYLLLCMNSIMYFLLTSYTLIMFLKVLSQFIMKIK